MVTFRDLNAEANSGYASDINGNGFIDGGDLLEDPNWENGLDDDRNGFLDDLIGWDSYDDDNDPAPVSNNHGTKSAQIIGGVGNNGIGGAGLNWQVRMVPIRVRAGGAARIASDIVDGFDYALVSDASIVNAAWRSSPRMAENPLETASEFSQDIFDAIDRTREAGLLVVTAAGNGGRDTDAHPWYPQSHDVDNMISAAALSATNDQLDLSSVTNWGRTTVELASPTTNGATSHALSVTTGVAALIKSQHPDWTYAQIKDRMLQSVDPLPSLDGKTVSGGKINAAKALGNDVGTIIFADSFEAPSWNGLWVTDGQPWIRTGRPSFEGSFAAGIGRSDNATLSLANAVDTTPYSSVELSFYWYIEGGFESGEYLALDLFDGTQWTEVATLLGGVDQEDIWHEEAVQLDARYLVEDFRFRFRAKSSSLVEAGYVDRVELVALSSLPAEPGDFDRDSQLACSDIDSLAEVIVAGTNTPAFDLTQDGIVNDADMNAWLVLGGLANLPSGSAYLPGDATLDGKIDARDLNKVALHWQAQSVGWCGGDFTADGFVNAQDLNGLASNWLDDVSVASPGMASLPRALNGREPRAPLQVRSANVLPVRAVKGKTCSSMEAFDLETTQLLSCERFAGGLHACEPIPQIEGAVRSSRNGLAQANASRGHPARPSDARAVSMLDSSQDVDDAFASWRGS